MVAAGHMKRVSRARCDFSRGAVSSGVNSGSDVVGSSRSTWWALCVAT